VGQGAGTQPLPMTPLPRAAKVLMSVMKAHIGLAEGISGA
jgi:hypothetical protein